MNCFLFNFFFRFLELRSWVFFFKTMIFLANPHHNYSLCSIRYEQFLNITKIIKFKFLNNGPVTMSNREISIILFQKMFISHGYCVETIYNFNIMSIIQKCTWIPRRVFALAISSMQNAIFAQHKKLFKSQNGIKFSQKLNMNIVFFFFHLLFKT